MTEIIDGLKGCKENIEEISHVRQKTMITYLEKKMNSDSLIRSRNSYLQRFFNSHIRDPSCSWKQSEQKKVAWLWAQSSISVLSLTNYLGDFTPSTCQRYQPSLSFSASHLPFSPPVVPNPFLPRSTHEWQPGKTLLAVAEGQETVLAFSLLGTHFTTQCLVQLKSNWNVPPRSAFLNPVFVSDVHRKVESTIQFIMSQYLTLGSTFVVSFV